MQVKDVWCSVNNVAKTQEATGAPDPDLLAAVVLDTIVGAGTRGMTFAQVAHACQRDLGKPEEVGEVHVALDMLMADDLAIHKGNLYRPTRAAIRAAELSF